MNACFPYDYMTIEYEGDIPDTDKNRDIINRRNNMKEYVRNMGWKCK